MAKIQHNTYLELIKNFSHMLMVLLYVDGTFLLFTVLSRLDPTKIFFFFFFLPPPAVPLKKSARPFLGKTV